MNDEFKKAYNDLDVNTKRDQLSNELIIISELIKRFEDENGIPSVLTVKNYSPNNDQNLSESEMLNFIYEDVYNIQKELITIFSKIYNDQH